MNLVLNASLLFVVLQTGNFSIENPGSQFTYSGKNTVIWQMDIILLLHWYNFKRTLNTHHQR